MKQYDRADATFYDYYATGIEGDAQFYVEEAQRAGSPVLELGCGTGRILIPVAETGITIVGLDRAPSMLAIARQKISRLSAETQRCIELVEGDMRDFSLDRRFKLVMIPYRAFQHLLTPEDQRQALRCIREHLTEDGCLILNVFDPDLRFIAAHSGPYRGFVRKSSEFVHPGTGHRVVVQDCLQYNLGQQIVTGDFTFEELGEEEKVIAKRYTQLTIRYAYRYEMEYLLEVCGFEIEALYGNFQREPFQHGGEQIWIACRKRTA